MPRLDQLATTIRSKNAGVDHVTFDIIFTERASFERVRDSGAVTRSSVAQLFRVAEESVTDFVVFDPANAIKFSIPRSEPHGSFRDADVYGSQQYAPLLSVDIP